MDKKRKNIPKEVITRSVTELAEQTGNVYESVVIIGKRANQISRQRREELKERLEEFLRGTDTLEEVYQNHEQIEISRHFERLPNSTIIGTEEFLDEKLYFRHSSDTVSELRKK